jgi:glycosyltransferase involved in cell wall biosynthesis
MSRFPKITETFILFEILELERRGMEVRIFPLLRGRERVVHPEARQLLPRVRFLPFLSGPILAANARCFKRHPRRYLGVLAEVLWHNRGSLNFFVGALGIFPKTVRMAEEMVACGITHIHAHFASHPTLAALIVHRLTGLPFSFTAHGSDIHIDQTMFGRKLAAAAFAVTVCRYNVDFLAERVGEWVRDRLRVLHCGTDRAIFSTDHIDEGEEGAPRPALFGTDTFKILCVAALREVKGHRHLIQACRLLRDRGLSFECRLVGNGPLRRDLQRRIRAAGLADCVFLTGPLPRAQVCRAMRTADVVVLPSILGTRGDREGIPMVLMEACACGRPVVSSRQSGIPELVEHGREGLLCPPGDAHALAVALQRLAENPSLRQRMGEAGRRRVLSDFDQRHSAAALAGLLTAAADGRSALAGEREKGR